MAKKAKKDLGPIEQNTNKIYNLEEFDEMTAEQFYAGKREGMYRCHDVFSDSIERLRRSLEDVWAIEYTGIITSDKKARVAELTFAIDTLTTFHDMFQGEYDETLSKLEQEVEHEGDSSWAS